jgi:hypothetical protein
MNKLRIGDKIKWNVSVGGGNIYTVLDIDTSRTVEVANGTPFYSHIHIEWRFGDNVYKTWSGNLDMINEKLCIDVSSYILFSSV